MLEGDRGRSAAVLFCYNMTVFGNVLLKVCVTALSVGLSFSAIANPSVANTNGGMFAWRGFMLDEGRHFFGK